MGLTEWLWAFRELHERARRGELPPADRDVYLSGRDELARALLAAKRVSLKPGETPRQALRVARALQVDLETTTSRQRAMTIDLSLGGFSCLLAKAPPANEDMRYVLRLPAGDTFEGIARAVEVTAQPGNVRVSFSFRGMSESARERLELLIFDAVLAQLA